MLDVAKCFDERQLDGSTNGWNVWKDESGKTLDEYRKK